MMIGRPLGDIGMRENHIECDGGINGMTLNVDVFDLTQWPFFVQDAIGRSQLANVVHQTCNVNQLAGGFGKAHLQG